jgi:uncharacterized protein with HEPN domain
MDNVKKTISIVKHMAAYCQQITEMVARFGDSIDAFKADNAYRHACTMCILQIGELSTHLTDDFKRVYSEMPWKKIKAMRNVFAHTYDEISFEQTWNTVKESIPELAAFCERIIEQYHILEQPAVEIEYNEDIEPEDQFEDEDEIEP